MLTERRWSPLTNGKQITAARTSLPFAEDANSTMTDHEIDKLITEFQTKHPSIMDGAHVRRDPVHTIERLAEIEREHGVVLPAQYKRHLCKHGAGDFGHTWIYAPEGKEGAGLWEDYYYMPQHKGRFLPISDNGCGDHYGFRIVDNVCADFICFADHEQDYELSDAVYPDFNTFIAEVGLSS